MLTILDARKRVEAGRRAGVASVLAERLGPFARAHGGRYLLFGSLARGAVRHDSDVDLLLDFPPEAEAEAWRFAEGTLAEMGMAADIMPMGWCKPAFLAKVLPGAKVLS